MIPAYSREVSNSKKLSVYGLANVLLILCDWLPAEVIQELILKKMELSLTFSAKRAYFPSSETQSLEHLFKCATRNLRTNLCAGSTTLHAKHRRAQWRRFTCEITKMIENSSWKLRGENVLRKPHEMKSRQYSVELALIGPEYFTSGYQYAFLYSTHK